MEFLYYLKQLIIGRLFVKYKIYFRNILYFLKNDQKHTVEFHFRTTRLTFKKSIVPSLQRDPAAGFFARFLPVSLIKLLSLPEMDGSHVFNSTDPLDFNQPDYTLFLKKGFLTFKIRFSFNDLPYGYLNIKEEWTMRIFSRYFNPLLHLSGYLPGKLMIFYAGKHLSNINRLLGHKISYEQTVYPENNPAGIIFDCKNLFFVQLELNRTDFIQLLGSEKANGIPRNEIVSVFAFRCKSLNYKNKFTDYFSQKLPVCVLFYHFSRSKTSGIAKWNLAGFYSDLESVSRLIQKNLQVKIFEPDSIKTLPENNLLILPGRKIKLESGSGFTFTLADDFQLKDITGSVQNVGSSGTGIINSFSAFNGKILI